jgi:hypothetical protein
LPSLSVFDPLVQSSILMRFSQSAVLDNSAEQAISLISPEFPLAFLYLSASRRAPVDLDSATFVQTGRLGGLTFYYSGLNHLFLRGFGVARGQLFHALNCKNCRDFSSEIVKAFALSCFLTHLSQRQCRELLPIHCDFPDVAASLWNFRQECQLSNL